MLGPEKINELHTQIQYRLIEKLTESEQRYRSLVENLREIIFECDLTGMLTFVNQAWTSTLGHPVKDVVGKCLGSFINVADISLWQSALQAKTNCHLELRFHGQDGSLFWLELAMQFRGKSGFSGALINITERKQAAMLLKQANEALEDRVKQRTAELIKTNQELQHTIQRLQCAQGQLVHREKMSSLGQLVAGVAHEINNPVSFVHCNLEPAQEYVRDILLLLELYQKHYPQPVSSIQDSLESFDIDFIKGDFPRLLDSMEMGTERIRKIVDSLRSFSRFEEASLQRVDIHEGINNTLLILNHRLKGAREIQLNKDYSELPLIDCFPDQLNQVFMNLVSNAIDALLGSGDDGETCFDQGGAEPAITVRTYAGERSVVVEISDNGPGISKDVVGKIFEPFFTTKPVGKGTGLGLSISHQIIVETHSGRISCISDIGKGTTFRVQLPLELPRLHVQQQIDGALQPGIPNQVANT